jgi:hypothetical protein
VPGDHVDDEIARAHAFAVSVITQAMAVEREMVTDGPITRGLAMNLDEYQRVWSTWLPEKFRRVAVRAHTVVDDEPFRPARRAMCFSGSLDSCYTAMLMAPDDDLAALAAIHGLDGATAIAHRANNGPSVMRPATSHARTAFTGQAGARRTMAMDCSCAESFATQ